MASVDLDVTPEPSRAEHRALHEALRRLVFTRENTRVSAWWREGVRENVLDDDEEEAPPSDV